MPLVFTSAGQALDWIRARRRELADLAPQVARAIEYQRGLENQEGLRRGETWLARAKGVDQKLVEWELKLSQQIEASAQNSIQPAVLGAGALALFLLASAALVTALGWLTREGRLIVQELGPKLNLIVWGVIGLLALFLLHPLWEKR